MAQVTVKTPYYYELLTEKKGNGKRTHRIISNFFQGLLLVFAKKARISFPLVRIWFKNGELAGQEFFIHNINPPGNPAGYIKIGRENAQREKFFIELSQQTVSRIHARIVFFNGEMFIINYSKVNPTQINGRTMPFNCSIPLPVGAVISIGGVEFTTEKIKF